MPHNVGMVSFDVYRLSGHDNKAKKENYSMPHNVGMVSFDVYRPSGHDNKAKKGNY